jgi:geranylgeranylglycerol-phosphate geranylgeranyltransferase
MTSNDYFDLEVDRIYHHQRPLPSGRVSIFELLIINCLFPMAGFIASTPLDLLVLALATLMWVVGISYNWRYKETGLPGSVIVAFCVAMTFILGGMAVNKTAKGLIWTFGLLAFVFVSKLGDRQRCHGHGRRCHAICQDSCNNAWEGDCIVYFKPIVLSFNSE